MKEMIEFWVKKNVIVVMFVNFVFMDFVFNWVWYLIDVEVINIFVGMFFILQYLSIYFDVVYFFIYSKFYICFEFRMLYYCIFLIESGFICVQV